MDYNCVRCAGKGRITAYANVLGGVCFKCNGSGRQASKPRASAVLWAVFLVNRETGQGDRIWNIRAKSSASAMSSAQEHYNRASSMFHDQFTMNGAVAVRADELDDPTQVHMQLEGESA